MGSDNGAHVDGNSEGATVVEASDGCVNVGDREGVPALGK